MTDDIFYIPPDQDPSSCLFCAKDMTHPKGWKHTPIDGLYVIVECANCETEYMVVMHIEQAAMWDHMLLKQFEDMKKQCSDLGR